MRPALRAITAMTFALLLAGCATTLDTQVTSFHRLFDGLQGQRFVVAPTPDQKDSLEFASYADLVRQALEGKGLVDADAATADLRVTLHYSVDGVASMGGSGTRGYAGFGLGSGGFSVGSFGIGIGIPIGSGADRPIEPGSYQRSLRVEIDRIGEAGVAPGAAGTRVYEARAISEGPSSALAPVMPAMVRAVFDDFPGPNGKTRVVSVPLEETR